MKENQVRDDLNFRIGGVGITKVNYDKSVSNHIEFLKKLAGISSSKKEEVANNESKIVEASPNKK